LETIEVGAERVQAKLGKKKKRGGEEDPRAKTSGQNKTAGKGLGGQGVRTLQKPVTPSGDVGVFAQSPGEETADEVLGRQDHGSNIGPYHVVSQRWGRVYWGVGSWRNILTCAEKQGKADMRCSECVHDEIQKR